MASARSSRPASPPCPACAWRRRGWPAQWWHFECELAQIQPYPADKPSCYLIFARVLLAHIDDAVLRDERHVDPARLDLVGRLGGTQYAFTRDTFSMIRPK